MDASSMRAIAVRGGKGEAQDLEIVEIPVPEPGPGEILVRVSAAGVNRPDIIQRRGLYAPPPGAPETLGLEVAGAVVRGAGRWREGDQVCALLGGGGYAQYASVDARHALPVPKGLTLIEAAALPETVFTVWANVFEHGALKLGETSMVHGATSGIGVIAIQMARAAGARVIATARGAEKAARARALGADLAVDAEGEDFSVAARGFGGADVVLDMVGGPYFEKNLEALNTGGRIVYIAAQGGAEITVPVFRLMARRAVITGSLLRPRDADEKARIARAVEDVVWPWIEAGKVRPVIEATFPLAEAAAAHALLEGGGHVGKVVLTP